MKSATDKPPDPGNEKAALAGGSLKTVLASKTVIIGRANFKPQRTFTTAPR